MHGMHFQVLSNSVDGVFRTGVEMELHTVVLFRCTQVINGVHRAEGLGVLALLEDRDLGCVVSLPHHCNVILLIGVEFLEIVFVARDEAESFHG